MKKPITTKEQLESLQLMFQLACEALEKRDDKILRLQSEIDGLKCDLDHYTGKV